MRREAMRLTPPQRMARVEAMVRQSFETLMKSPEGWDRFWRRNLRKRAVHHGPTKPA